MKLRNSFGNLSLYISLVGASLIFSHTLLASNDTQPAVSLNEQASMDLLVQPSQIELKLYALECGLVQVNNLAIFNPYIPKGTRMDLPSPCFLIQHPEKGYLLWDAGLNDALIKYQEGVEYFNGEMILKVNKTLSSQLLSLGLKNTDIDFFSPSHLHLDHGGNANDYAESTLIVQKVEYDTAFSEHAAQYGMLIENHHKLKDAKRIELKGDYDVFGDGSVVVLSTPGHSPGHQSLFVKLDKTGPILLSGDLYHFQQNRDEYGMPIFNDKKMTIQSFAKVDKILDKTGAKLWIQHDPVFNESLLKSPLFYQ